MKLPLRIAAFALLFLTVAPKAFGAPSLNLTLKTDWQLFDVSLGKQDIFSEYTKSVFHGFPVLFPPEQADAVRPLVQTETVRGIDVIKLRDYLERKIAPDIFREREDVAIDLDIDGRILFEGAGLYGRRLDSMAAAFAVKMALENDITFVNLPILREEPRLTVHPKLLKKGIKELVSSGETVFKGSPDNRINNITVGIGRFSGHLIKPGEEFVFGDILGKVDETTGYKKELVIAGDRTVPEYGGGLCQVSTTAYRAALAGGFPVTKRRNHSYAVSYYLPIGLDATVYPPQVDLKFVNDSDSSLLMQSFVRGNKAYYNLYGTKDERDVQMIGPFYSDRVSPPPPRLEYTTKLPPGEQEVLGHAVSGVKALWYREVTYADPEKKPYFETIYSVYQARPDFRAVGVTAEELAKQRGDFTIQTTF